MAASTSASLFKMATQPHSATRLIPANPSVSNSIVSTFLGASLPTCFSKKNKTVKISRRMRVNAAAAVATTPSDSTISEYVLPSWAMFELGRAPVYWKTMNGLPPTSGEKLKLFYNPVATKLDPNEAFGIAFNGGFNQPIMCGGEPREMLKKTRGKADPPIYTIQICIPKHAVNLIFSFTNGAEWDGPYRLQFQVPKGWQNKPIEFFNEGLAEELSKEGACDRAIFPDSNIIIDRCTIMGNLAVEGGDRCSLDLVPGCMDTSSHLYNPLANVDDGTCAIDSED